MDLDAACSQVSTSSHYMHSDRIKLKEAQKEESNRESDLIVEKKNMGFIQIEEAEHALNQLDHAS